METKPLYIPYLLLQREIDRATAEINSGDVQAMGSAMRFLILADFIVDTVDGFEKLVEADKKTEADSIKAKV